MQRFRTFSFPNTLIFHPKITQLIIADLLALMAHTLHSDQYVSKKTIHAVEYLPSGYFTEPHFCLEWPIEYF